MENARFDILFAGELEEEANPFVVRRQLQELLMLSEKAAAQLFSGETFALRRGVDVATAARYRKAIGDTGAIVRIRKAAPAETNPAEPATPGWNELQLQSRTRQNAPLEPQAVAEGPVIDFSHLSLTPGNDWTLEDCQPPAISAELPDTSHLKLVPI